MISTRFSQSYRKNAEENVLRYEKKIAGIEEHYGAVVKS